MHGQTRARKRNKRGTPVRRMEGLRGRVLAYLEDTMSTRAISRLLTLALLGGLALAPVAPATAADKTACEQAARDAGLKPKGRHLGSVCANQANPGGLRRAVSLVGSLLDQPAPNPIYNVTVARCERAAGK